MINGTETKPLVVYELQSSRAIERRAKFFFCFVCWFVFVRFFFACYFDPLVTLPLSFEIDGCLHQLVSYFYRLVQGNYEFGIRVSKLLFI